jgi:hypothetical protein
VDSIEVEPASPREVYEGYERRVIINYRSPAAPEARGMKLLGGETGGPMSAELLHRKNGFLRKLNLQRSEGQTSTWSGAKNIIHTLRLSHIPASAGEITLRCTVPGPRYYYRTAAGATTFITPKLKTIMVVVRKADEKIQVPRVSKYRPFVLKSLATQRRDPAKSMDENDYEVKVVLESTAADADFHRGWRFLRPRLIDGWGREHRFTTRLKSGDWARISEMSPIEGGLEADKPNTCTRWFRFPLRLVPKSAGRVTFKTEASYNDGWPMPIEVVVRKN